MNQDELTTVVAQLYQAVTGQKPQEVDGRIRSGVEAALKVKEADENLFYGLVTIGLTEAKNRFKLSEQANDYADRLIGHYAGMSSYMQTTKKD